MPIAFQSLADLLNHGFDDVIDVRSPAEFAEDHVPGALNLPALNNDQRAKVGTIYKQVSPFDARKIGAGMVIRNVATAIDGPFREKDGAWRPLVYCWRGGQRSGVFGGLLAEVGWRAETLKGGYVSYRRLVKALLYDTQLPHRFVLLDGYTGTAKTEVLHELRDRGCQSIDLEGLAHHRGSLLGDMPGGQPTQKTFETRIAAALAQFDTELPVLLEAESSKIGKLILPKGLWTAMMAAPRIEISAPLPDRAKYLARHYADVISDPVVLADRLAPLRRIRGHEVVDHWIDLSRQGALPALCAALAAQHYDPAYDKSRSTLAHPVMAGIDAVTLDKAGISQVADQILRQLKSL